MSADDRLARRRRYRRLIFGSALAGTAGFIAAESAGYPLVGVGLYWVGFGAFLAVWQGTSVTLFDERDRALERRAITVSYSVMALALIVLWPTLRVLSAVDIYAPPPAFDGVVLAVSVQAGLFAVAYAWLRYR